MCSRFLRCSIGVLFKIFGEGRAGRISWGVSWLCKEMGVGFFFVFLEWSFKFTIVSVLIGFVVNFGFC